MARQKNDGKGNHGVHRGPSKVPKEVKDKLKQLILNPDNMDRIEDSLKKLYESGDYEGFLRLNRAYLEFFVPKQASVTVKDGERKASLRSELKELTGL